jgi:hypothetical protein
MKAESICKYREDFNEVHAFTALRLTTTGASPAAKRTRILSMTQHADNIWNEGKFLPLFIGGVESAVHLRVDIPHTGGRCFDLSSEDYLQQYLKFPYECFLSVLSFEGYCRPLWHPTSQ